MDRERLIKDKLKSQFDYDWLRVDIKPVLVKNDWKWEVLKMLWG